MKRIIFFTVLITLIGCTRQQTKAAYDLHLQTIAQDRKVEIVNVNPPYTPDFYPVRLHDKVLKVWVPGYTVNDSITVGPHYIFVLVKKGTWVNSNVR